MKSEDLKDNVRYIYTDDEGSVEGRYVGQTKDGFKFLPDGFPPFFVAAADLDNVKLKES
jgi:hypothetical protein